MALKDSVDFALFFIKVSGLAHISSLGDEGISGLSALIPALAFPGYYGLELHCPPQISSFPKQPERSQLFPVVTRR